MQVQIRVSESVSPLPPPDGGAFNSLKEAMTPWVESGLNLGGVDAHLIANQESRSKALIQWDNFSPVRLLCENILTLAPGYPNLCLNNISTGTRVFEAVCQQCACRVTEGARLVATTLVGS